MCTAIEQYLYFSLAVTGQDDGVGAHLGDEVIVGIGYQAFVTDEQPCFREDTLGLGLEYFFVGKERTADHARICFYQVLDRSHR